MASARSIEEVERIRPAFSSNGKLGILESIVRTGRERTANLVVDVEKIKKTYAEIDCKNTIKLVEFLELDGQRIQELGSGSIDFAGVTRGAFTIEAARSLQELYIGNPRKGLTPLLWLAYLAEGIQNVLPEQVNAFDEICGEFLAMSTGPHTPLTELE